MLVTWISNIGFCVPGNQQINANMVNWEHLNNRSMKSPWICFVKNILTDLGFSHVWDNQGTFNASSLVVCIKAKLKERFISYWKNCMKSEAGMDKLRTLEQYK